ncbi:hypothetical protein Sinac_2540 [Singulisphaera acidiphila DSM 18658]|uniref:Uncharacterized protein n=1 Tax=Singulisphaera acidiphila (strain ATCC BAA-1392 / DSM 18658 / VKM B-2454 / MOB10) TaxID=886293 RepID=L0DC86_SINAD|nr:hypothetical protein Sinac_2540 [Singulisphaera acidiphila DSM 18658]
MSLLLSLWLILKLLYFGNCFCCFVWVIRGRLARWREWRPHPLHDAILLVFELRA